MGEAQMESTKTRHGCLTAWLILMILANALTAVTTPLFAASIRQAIPGFPEWVVWPIVLLAVLNVVFAVALFKWKKWGFLGCCFSSEEVCGVRGWRSVWSRRYV